MSIVNKSGLLIDYDKENKNIFIRWGKTENYFISEDHGDFVLDFDKNNKIIGIELLYFDANKEYCGE